MKELLRALWKKPKDAIAYLKSKKKAIVTKKWDELEKEVHEKSFTVAGIMSADLLTYIHKELVKSRQKGTTIKEFIKTIKPTLEKAGWTGAKPSRIKLIYETNMRTTHARSLYDAQKRLSNILPYWYYGQKQRNTKRDDHSKFDGKVFRHDDPIWNKIYPPSDFGCGCRVTAIDEKRAKEIGISVGSELFDLAKLPDNKLVSSKNWHEIKKQMKKDGKAYPPEIEKHLDALHKAKGKK